MSPQLSVMVTAGDDGAFAGLATGRRYLALTEHRRSRPGSFVARDSDTAMSQKWHPVTAAKRCAIWAALDQIRDRSQSGPRSVSEG